MCVYIFINFKFKRCITNIKRHKIGTSKNTNFETIKDKRVHNLQPMFNIYNDFEF